MITAKFGGTSLTPRNLYHLKEIVTNSHGAIVVSAIGKEFACDSKVTDLLLRLYCGEDSNEKLIYDKYHRLADVIGGNLDVDKLLFDAFSRAKSSGTRSAMLSVGEEVSSKLVASYLSVAHVEAEEVIRFKCGRFDYAETKRRLKGATRGVKSFVLGGFYGGSDEGRVVFSRGGSDITGAVCANVFDCFLYENWTDVSGVFVADPHIVPSAKSLQCLSYSEMYELSKLGANVLNKGALSLVKSKGIPIRIGNTLYPFSSSTVISNMPCNEKVVGITEKKESNFLTSVLSNLPNAEVLRWVGKAVKSNADVFSVKFDGKVCHIATNRSILRSLCDVMPVD